MNNLARVYFNLGKYNQCISLSEECYRLSVEIFGMNHSFTLSILQNLTRLQKKKSLKGF